MAVFCAGALGHAALRRVAVGREVSGQPARVAGFALGTAEAGPWSVLVPADGSVDGLLLDLTPDEVARLGFLMAVLGQKPVAVRAGGVAATLFTGPGGIGWDEAGWTGRFAALAVATAGDIMAQFGRAKPAALAARLTPMRVRAASRLRAVSAPTTLRHHAGPGDVTVVEDRFPYGRFFGLEEYDVSWRRFDGTMSVPVTRAAFISGDAVTVLPYDPVRDRVLVVEQFRAGPVARGDCQAWQIEAIAGRIDPGEGPEAAARREAVEEAGLALAELIPVARYYPSPGAVSEYIYSYVALVDLPDGSAGVFGVPGEAEDIRGHLIGFDRLMELVGSGEIENAPLVLTALWLQRERGRLRK